MKRTVLVSLLCLFGVIQVLGQAREIKSGPIVNTPKGNTKLLGLVKFDQTGYYVVWKQRSSPYKVLLEHYSYEHEQLWQKEFASWKEKQEGRTPKKILCIGGKMVLYSVFNNTKEKKLYAYFQQLNDSGELSGEELLADSIEFSTKYYATNTDFEIIRAEDSSCFILSHKTYYGKQEGWTMHDVFINADLKIGASKTWDIPYPEVEFITRKLDRQFFYYALVNVRQKLGDETGASMVLTAFPLKNNWNAYTFDKLITQRQLFFTADGSKARIAGFYYQDENVGREKESSVAGFFMATVTIGAPGVFSIVKYPFDEQRIQQILPNGYKSGEIVPGFSVAATLVYSDTQIVVVAERCIITAHTVSSSNGATSVYHICRYERVLCLSVNPKGNLHWVSTFYRRYIINNGSDDGPQLDVTFSEKEVTVLYREETPTSEPLPKKPNSTVNPHEKEMTLHVSDGVYSLKDAEQKASNKSAEPTAVWYYTPNLSVGYWLTTDDFGRTKYRFVTLQVD